MLIIFAAILSEFALTWGFRPSIILLLSDAMSSAALALSAFVLMASELELMLIMLAEILSEFAETFAITSERIAELPPDPPPGIKAIRSEF